MISVIIPTYQRPEQLRENLRLLVPQLKRPGILVEIIITDDSRDTNTKKMIQLEFPMVIWTQGPQRGPAANRNHGAFHANGEWLIFLDDDILPDPNFLNSYAVGFSDRNSSELIAWEGATIREKKPVSLLWEAPHNPNGGHLISCNFGLSTSTFEKLGGFDSRYSQAAFEDTEFAQRFRRLNGQTIFLPDAKVIHPLRLIPGSRKLADKWEGRVIFALDQGASSATLTWRLPLHVFRVIQSRIRKKRWNRENCKAFARFALEFIWVCWLTPAWVWKWRREPRSPFWSEQVAKGLKVPKFGF